MGVLSRNNSNARLVSLPSNSNLLGIEKQNSFSGVDVASTADPVTPRTSYPNQYNAFSPPISVETPDILTTPSTMSNKAFKLVPMRKHPSGNLNTDAISPSMKKRSNSTSETLGTAGGVPPSVRPATERRSGHYHDSDDEDDSYSMSNWRNITLDPS